MRHGPGIAVFLVPSGTEASFLELLDAVKTTATDAYEHQVYPFDRLVDELDACVRRGRR